MKKRLFFVFVICLLLVGCRIDKFSDVIVVDDSMELGYYTEYGSNVYGYYVKLDKDEMKSTQRYFTYIKISANRQYFEAVYEEDFMNNYYNETIKNHYTEILNARDKAADKFIDYCEKNDIPMVEETDKANTGEITISRKFLVCISPKQFFDIDFVPSVNYNVGFERSASSWVYFQKRQGNRSVLPAMIICLIIVVLVLIVCLALYRRKRTGRRAKTDDDSLADGRNGTAHADLTDDTSNTIETDQAYDRSSTTDAEAAYDDYEYDNGYFFKNNGAKNSMKEIYLEQGRIEGKVLALYEYAGMSIDAIAEMLKLNIEIVRNIIEGSRVLHNQ